MPELTPTNRAPVISYSRWSPVANVVLIVLAFLWASLTRKT